MEQREIEAEVETTRRLLADVPVDIHWAIKIAATERHLKMKELVPLAVIHFLGLNFSAKDLGLDERCQKFLDRR